MGYKKSKLKSAIEALAVFGGIIGAVVGFGLSFISLSSVSVGGIIGLSVLAAFIVDNLCIFKGKVSKAAFLLGGLPLGTFMGAGLGVAVGALFPSCMSS